MPASPFLKLSLFFFVIVKLGVIWTLPVVDDGGPIYSDNANAVEIFDASIVAEETSGLFSLAERSSLMSNVGPCSSTSSTRSTIRIRPGNENSVHRQKLHKRTLEGGDQDVVEIVSPHAVVLSRPGIVSTQVTDESGNTVHGSMHVGSLNTGSEGVAWEIFFDIPSGRGLNSPSASLADAAQRRRLARGGDPSRRSALRPVGSTRQLSSRDFPSSRSESDANTPPNPPLGRELRTTASSPAAQADYDRAAGMTPNTRRQLFPESRAPRREPHPIIPINILEASNDSQLQLEDWECPVCLHGFDTPSVQNPQDLIKTSCCLTVFHSECFKRWILGRKTTVTCPTCRAAIAT